MPLSFASIPWRFLLGLSCGFALAISYHAYTLRGIELAESERLYQEQLAAWVAQKSVAAIDQKYTRELNDAQAKIDDLASDLAANRKRLRVKVAGCVPGTNTASMGHGDFAELDRETRQRYLDLRRLLERKERQIAALQEIILSQPNISD